VSVVDLFAGCGGLSLGVTEGCRALGLQVRHEFAVEFNPIAADVYRSNFSPTNLSVGPIQELVSGELEGRLTSGERRLRSQLDGVDLVVAGPPCQGHSDLNNHTRRKDPKNALYLSAARFALTVRPRALVIENVPGVVHDRTGVVDRTQTILERAGYGVSTVVVRADELGVPQTRRRHVLLATLDGRVDMTQLNAFRTSPRGVDWAIGDLRESPNRDDLFNTSSRHSPENRRRIDYLFEHDLFDLPDSERPDCHSLRVHSYKAVYGRMRPDRPAPTITAGFGSTGQGRFLHPHEPRTLTPHEAARLQGFPDYFDFSAARGRRALQELIGNAVPSRLGYVITLLLLR
jgi:DNA (cytosine-5)-methyltransferase 1